MDDADHIFAAGGAMEAVLEAKRAGKVRYIGFTGHKSPEIHLKTLATAASHHFHFDAVQMPLNVMDAHYQSFEKKVLPVLVEQEIGVLGMKPMGDAVILESRTATPIECLHYAMNLPTNVVITGCNVMSAAAVAPLVTVTAALRGAKPIRWTRTVAAPSGTSVNR